MSSHKHDLHTHSDFSDGTCSVIQLVEQGCAVRLDCVAITDHFWPSLGARKGGLKIIEERRTIIRELREEFTDISILDGIEVDIEMNGRLAPVAGGLQQFDVVIASLHYRCESHTWAQIITKMLENDSPHILGHWDGYLLSYDERDGMAVARALAEHNVAVELSHRYPTQYEHFLIVARDCGCQFTLGSDAHDSISVGRIQVQRQTAQSLGLPIRSPDRIQSVV